MALGSDEPQQIGRANDQEVARVRRCVVLPRLVYNTSHRHTAARVSTAEKQRRRLRRQVDVVEVMLEVVEATTIGRLRVSTFICARIIEHRAACSCAATRWRRLCWRRQESGRFDETLTHDAHHRDHDDNNDDNHRDDDDDALRLAARRHRATSPPFECAGARASTRSIEIPRARASARSLARSPARSSARLPPTRLIA